MPVKKKEAPEVIEARRLVRERKQMLAWIDAAQDIAISSADSKGAA